MEMIPDHEPPEPRVTEPPREAAKGPTARALGGSIMLAVTIAGMALARDARSQASSGSPGSAAIVRGASRARPASATPSHLRAPGEIEPDSSGPQGPDGTTASPVLPSSDVPAQALAPAPAPPVCYDCFWTYQPASLREDLRLYYTAHRLGDPLLDADRRYLLARMTGGHEALCEARAQFSKIAGSLTGRRRLLALETVAFTAEECGASAEEGFAAAARAAGESDEPWKADVYAQVSQGTFHPVFGEARAAARELGPADATTFVLGESAIHVGKGERIGVQIERTVRDWLSNQFLYDLSGTPPKRADVLPYHEGARLSDILAGLENGGARVEPLSGALAVLGPDDRWLAPDEQGVFRYEVLPDKIQYPTTRAWKGLALLVDTHGISSLVERAVHDRAGLVIGCGDSPAKMAAAAHLASLGTDVYFPCDRFVSEVLGYEGPGTLVGSAPVHAEDGGVVIGGQPVSFRVAETIVAEDAHMRGAFQYYDAPARYFRRLAQAVPLRLEIVAVDGPGESGRVVERARALDAAAIAVRVQTREDAGPVRSWLKESPSHRAVLFHTAAYPDGYVLFREFPAQTTFGDPRPRFLGGAADPAAATAAAADPEP